MKIGILTFHWATNHGALLQTYALQKYLTDNVSDAEVSIIDYYPPRYRKSLKKCFCSKHITAILRNLKDYRKEKILAPFRSFWNSTYRYNTTKQLCDFPPQYDILICGSDQVWNEYFTMSGEGRQTSAYYLPFQPNARRFSYAASFGAATLKPEMEAFIKPYLEQFDAISVREKTGCEIIRKMGLSSNVVCDPTALLSAQDYLSMAEYPFTGEYAVRYVLRVPNGKARKVLQDADRMISSRYKVYDIESLTVGKWLGALSHARFMITNSFHGVMFCLKFHIPFIVVPEVNTLAGMNDRFYTLLDVVDISNRIVTDSADAAAAVKYEIDWNSIDTALQKYTEKSKQFLADNCRIEKKSKSINFYRRSECTGCGACAQKCPRNCIQMISDAEGFVYPHIDTSRCVHCGICFETCPVKKPLERSGIKKAYVAYSKACDIRDKSSSGGVFSVLAESILSEGGAVFGAAFDDQFRLVHTGIENKSELCKLRGSKYIQSDTSTVYKTVKSVLEGNRLVLFCGTPCEVAGLKKYLGKEYSDLITADFICHGVPSPKIWEKYCRELMHRYSSGIKSVNFRDKSSGWLTLSLRISFCNDKEFVDTIDNEPYFRAFLTNLSLRPSCYDCAFKGEKRCSDITLADAWGIEKLYPQMNDDRGTSLVLIHTAKGEELFNKIQSNMEYLSVREQDTILSRNTALNYSVPIPSKRNAFFADAYTGKSLSSLIRRYCKTPLILALKKKAKVLLKKWK